MKPVLGIDFGGSSIKGALVDVAEGRLVSQRSRIVTPNPATPDRVADVMAQMVESFAEQIGDDPVGVAIPAVVQHGTTRSAANIDSAWIDLDAQQLLIDRLERPVVLVNDADAAGMCEVQYGAAAGQNGVVLMSTLGTGIGSALISGGRLVPNTEFGHIEMNGGDAEQQASSGRKDVLGLSYEEWLPLIEQYFQTVEKMLWPDLIVVGGGVSRDSDKFLPHMRLRTRIVPAQHLNDAGIIGAAWVARHHPDGL